MYDVFPDSPDTGVHSDSAGGFMKKADRDALKRIAFAAPEEIAVAEKLVNDTILIELKDGEFAALVSFAMTVRPCDFTRSKLVKLVNQGKLLDASREFATWVMNGRRVSKILVTRREKEKALFLCPEVVVNNAKGKT